MVCLRFAVCLTTVLLAVCCWRAHSQPDNCGDFINITASTGNDVFPEDVARTCFQCFFGSPPAIDSTTTWTLDLNPITSLQGETVGGVLVIFDPVGTIGTAPVRLVCTTSSSDVLSVFAQALVLVPPGVEDMTVNEGDSVSLSCDSSTSTRIVGVQWRGPDGEVITDTRDLTIPDIQRNQSGVYTCFITNINGKTISGNGTVTVQYAPDVDALTPSPHFFPLGQSLTLSCSYDALPAPNVTWMRNAVELNPADSRISVTLDTTSNSSVLTVTGLQRNESGNYVCQFTNVVSSSVASIQVTVQVPPDPASNLQVTGRSTVTFDLTWNNPVFDGNSSLTGIRIEYQISGSSDVMNTSIGVVEMATLTDLRPFTNYNISVLVLNAVGPSDPESITDRTDSLFPLAPTITNLTAISSTALYVEWEAPRDTNTTAPFYFFVVRYSEVGGASMSNETDPTATSFVLPGLDKGTRYTVSVAAINEAGMGPFSTAMTAETDIDPPTPPRNVTVVGLTSQVLSVTWSPPLDPGGRDIASYELEVRKLGETVFEVLESLGAEMTDARIANREENTTYEVRVTAFSTLLGESAVANGTTPSIGEPQALLEAPEVEMITSSSVRLSWEFPGGEVSFYIVEYRRRVMPESVQTLTVNGTNQMTTIFGLNDSTTYEAQVRTRNDNGDSEPSPTVTFTTLARLNVSGPVDEVTAGELLTLTCSFAGGGAPSSPVQWFRGTNGALPPGATVNGRVLTFPDPQPGDSGVYTCSSSGDTASFTLTVVPATTPTPSTTPPEETGISDTVIIIVAVVGGVSLIVFLIVLTITICYCCRQRRSKANKGVYTVKTKTRGNWIETSGGAGSAAAGSSNERPPARAPSFHIPSEFTAHSSFNTLEKQNRIRRSQSPDPRPTQGAQGEGGVSYAQLDLSRPSGDVHGSTGNVQYTQVSATASPPVAHEVGSPTFQYIAQESLGFPAPRYGSGPLQSPENYDMTWPDGGVSPHYSNTVV